MTVIEYNRIVIRLGGMFTRMLRRRTACNADEQVMYCQVMTFAWLAGDTSEARRIWRSALRYKPKTKPLPAPAAARTNAPKIEFLLPTKIQ